MDFFFAFVSLKLFRGLRDLPKNQAKNRVWEPQEGLGSSIARRVGATLSTGFPAF